MDTGVKSIPEDVQKKMYKILKCNCVRRVHSYSTYAKRGLDLVDFAYARCTNRGGSGECAFLACVRYG